MRPLEFSMVLASLTLSSFGQVALKYGLRSFGSIGNLPRLFQSLATPYVILGLALYVVGALFWVTVLSRVKELSLVYPMISLSYVVVALLAWWFFGDHITPLRMLGIALIWAGVACVGFS